MNHQNLSNSKPNYSSSCSWNTVVDGICHDFGNILTHIMAIGQVLCDQAVKNAEDPLIVEDIAQRFFFALEQASALIHDLQDLNRPSHSNLQMLNVVELLQNLIHYTRGISAPLISFQSSAQRPVWALANYQHCLRVFNNLITNAIEASDERRPQKISIKLKVVQLRGGNRLALAAGSYALITFGDKGRGMSKEVRAKIFDPYFSQKQIYKNRGLGLTVARSFMEYWEGRILVSSTEGRGTCFSLFLPLVDGANGEQEISTTKESGVLADASALCDRMEFKTVLLIVEDPLLQSSLELQLKSFGIHATGIKRAVMADLYDNFMSSPHYVFLQLPCSEMSQGRFSSTLTLLKDLLRITQARKIIIIASNEIRPFLQTLEDSRCHVLSAPFSGKELLQLLVAD